MHDTSELFQRQKEVVQRVYHRDIHDWQPLPVSLDAFLVWEHLDPMIPFGSQLRTWHWYIYPETYLPISCAFFIFLAVWKVLQTWSKEMPLHFLVIKLSFLFHLQTCCLFPISYHISESKSGFLLKAAIVHKRTLLHAPQHPLLSCLSFPTLCMSYTKHISFAKINCHHRVFIFWKVWGIAQAEFHPTSTLWFACSNDYRRKVSAVLSLLLRPKQRFAIFEMQDKPFMFKLLLLVLGAIPVALFLIWRIAGIGDYWMQPHGLHFPSVTFSCGTLAPSQEPE